MIYPEPVTPGGKGDEGGEAGGGTAISDAGSNWDSTASLASSCAPQGARLEDGSVSGLTDNQEEGAAGAARGMACHTNCTSELLAGCPAGRSSVAQRRVGRQRVRRRRQGGSGSSARVRTQSPSQKRP
jgi:hypothetical protein